MAQTLAALARVLRVSAMDQVVAMMGAMRIRALTTLMTATLMTTTTDK
jgi:hypothetical protein